MLGRVLLLGGPAGAGKSTLARAWCATRPAAVHIELDVVRKMIMHGHVDPRDVDAAGQAEQWAASVEATCAAGRAFAHNGFDVVIDDLMLHRDVDELWQPRLAGFRVDLIIVLPRLAVLLKRSAARAKHVPDALIIDQRSASAEWSRDRLLDTSDLTVDESLEALLAVLPMPLQ